MGKLFVGHVFCQRMQAGEKRFDCILIVLTNFYDFHLIKLLSEINVSFLFTIFRFRRKYYHKTLIGLLILLIIILVITIIVVCIRSKSKRFHIYMYNINSNNLFVSLFLFLSFFCCTKSSHTFGSVPQQRVPPHSGWPHLLNGRRD